MMLPFAVMMAAIGAEHEQISGLQITGGQRRSQTNTGERDDA